MKKDVKGINMCEGPMFKNIFKFALPFMLTGLAQQLYHAADTVVAGRYAGQNALAGVGATGSLINLIITVFIGLSLGANITIARALGAKDEKGTNQLVHTAILISIICGVVISVFGIIFARPLLELMDIPAEVMPEAEIYMKIYFSGQTASLTYNFGASILRAKGDTKRPLYIVTISGLINVALNLFFVIYCKMGADGVASATVISQVFTAVAVLYILCNEDSSIRLKLRNLRIYPKQLVSILRVGLPAGLQSMVFSYANVMIQSGVNTFGAVAVAGNAASASIGSFYYVALDTFAQAAAAFVSQNMGAKNYARVKKAVLCCLGAEAMVWVTEIAITLLFGEKIIGFYAPDNVEAVRYGMMRLNIVGNTYGLCGCMIVMSSSLRGIGYSFASMIMSIIGVCGIRILWILTAFKAIGTFPSLFISFPLSWIGTFIMYSAFFVFAMKKIEKIK